MDVVTVNAVKTFWDVVKTKLKYLKLETCGEKKNEGPHTPVDVCYQCLHRVCSVQLSPLDGVNILSSRCLQGLQEIRVIHVLSSPGGSAKLALKHI